MGPNGYIKLYRKAFDNPFLNRGSFDSFHAFFYLVANANFMPRQVWFQKQIHDVQRGQLVTTQRQLARDWGWSRKKILNFLQLAEKMAILKPQSSHGCLLLTICNYEAYQGTDVDESQQRASKEPLRSQRGASEEPRHKKGKKGEEGQEREDLVESGTVNPKETTPTVHSMEFFLQILQSKKIRGSEKTFREMLPGWIASVGPEQAAGRIREAKDGLGVFELDRIAFAAKSTPAETIDQKYVRFLKGTESVEVAEKLLDEFFAACPPYPPRERDRKGRVFANNGGKNYKYDPQLTAAALESDKKYVEKMEREQPEKWALIKKELEKGGQRAAE